MMLIFLQELRQSPWRTSFCGHLPGDPVTVTAECFQGSPHRFGGYWLLSGFPHVTSKCTPPPEHTQLSWYHCTHYTFQASSRHSINLSSCLPFLCHPGKFTSWSPCFPSALFWNHLLIPAVSTSHWNGTSPLTAFEDLCPISSSPSKTELG